MVTHSGIQVSQTLIDSFKQDVIFISASIQEIEEQLVVKEDRIILVEEGDLQDVDTTIEHKSSYLFYYFKHEDKWLMITYIPDNSKVREKMLYASTQSNLLKELGEAKFHDKLRFSEKNELKYDNLVSYLNHDEEHENEEPVIKEALTITPKHSIISNFNLNYHDEVATCINQFKQDEIQLLLFSIDIKTEQISCSSPPQNAKVEFEQLIYLFPTDTPVFALFKFEYKENIFIVFVYSCPPKCILKDKMLYSASRNGILNDIINQGITIDVKVEIDDPHELDEAVIVDRLNLDKKDKDNSQKTFKVAGPTSQSGNAPRPRTRKR